MILDKVKDYEGLVKDRQSGAILLANHAKANEYIARKKALSETHELKKEINTIKERLDDIETVKNDVSDIKALLQQIANNGK
jgi:hypothetical protein